MRFNTQQSRQAASLSINHGSKKIIRLVSDGVLVPTQAALL